MRTSRMFTALAAVALLGVACEDDDATSSIEGLEVFTATLNGANERPDPAVTSATGTAVVTVMEDVMSWRVEVSNIENVNVGHFHVGPADSAGGVVWDLAPTAGDHPTPTVIALGSVQGDTVLALVALMRAGRAYVNIHTSDGAADPVGPAGDYPGGEVRGQLRKQ